MIWAECARGSKLLALHSTRRLAMPEPVTLDSLAALMARQRAVREFSPEPVDDALIERLIEAATRAPSAKNVQILRFLVVKDAAAKRRIAELVEEVPGPGRTAWDEVPVL